MAISNNSNHPADTIRRWREHPDIFVRECFRVTPDPWQDEVLKKFPTQQRIALQACKGPGKGHSKNLDIITPCGITKWGDLRKGSLVFAEDGTPTEVEETFELGLRQLYRVTFDDGASTLVTEDHLWKVQGRTERRKNLGWAVISTKEIVERGVTIPNGKWKQKQFIIPIQGAVRFPRVRHPLDEYLAGVWLGDGCRNQPSYFKPYAEVEDEINKRGYKTSRNKDGNIRILDSKDRFRQLECFDCYSYEKFIPDSYKYASIEQRKDLLCGLMDTDGGIDVDTHMEFSSTSKRLAEDVVWLVRSLGGVALIKATVKTGKYRGPDGEMVICRDCYRVSVKLPFNPFRIAHKAERWHAPQDRYLTRYIASIEPEGEPEDSMCIRVAHPSHCYLTNDFIVTHNTCLLAWLAWNFLLTRPQPKIAATSITGDNLADNLWSELALWQGKSELLKRTFTWQKTRIFANDHPETWWMSARQWSKSASPAEQGQTLAGLHADYILFLLDESGGMPDSIMAAADAALSSCKEGHIVQAGNPTMLEGPLYRAATVERNMWYVVEITGDPDDPHRSPRVRIEWANEQIQRYGRDNPYVLVNVFGRFPPSSFNSLIGPDEVAEAMRRYYRPQEYSDAARVLGVDVAREGDDASSIIGRQGLQAFLPEIYRNIDGTTGANIVARKWLDWNADACFIDNTGGFGSSWIDNLNRLGHAAIPVHFNQSSSNPRYFNKRTEMMAECVDWVKKGGALPESPRLLAAMTKTTYTFRGDKMLAEPKELIKVKLGHSPDEFDSLMLTFAAPVAKVGSRMAGVQGRHSADYQPLSREHLTGQDSRTQPSNHMTNYDPFGRK